MGSAAVSAEVVPESSLLMYARAFGGLYLRDLYVLRRELFPFAIRVLMNPLLFLFVFTFVMPHMSHGASASPMAGMGGGASFSTVLLPGLMAVAIMFSGIAAVALPLAQEFGITREIDDRVMCPLPVRLVAVEKIVFSAMQSMGRGGSGVSAGDLCAVDAGRGACDELAVSDRGAGAGEPGLGCAGVGDRDIGETAADRADLRGGGGADHVPGLRLLSLAALDKIPWLQYGVLINPIVYMSEGCGRR